MRSLFLLLLSLPGLAQNIPDSFVWHGKTWRVETVILILDSECNGECRGITYCGQPDDKKRKNLVQVVANPTNDSGASGARIVKEQQVIMLHELQHVVEDCSDLPTTQHHAIYDVSEPLMNLLRDPKNEPLKRWLFGK